MRKMMSIVTMLPTIRLSLIETGRRGLPSRARLNRYCARTFWILFFGICWLININAAMAISKNDGSELIGTQAPEFVDLTWLNHEDLTLKKLRGKVVLIRFWLADCPLCVSSSPALNELWQKYESKGLVVIGIHHPKSKTVRDINVVRSAADGLHFTFPIAIDDKWETINSMWLHHQRRDFTSASLLIDKSGKIQWVHPGGVLSLQHDYAHSTEFDRLESKIQTLLDAH